MTGDLPSDGIASRAAADAARLGTTPGQPRRVGEGVSDPQELRQLIALLQKAEAAKADERQDIQVGEFLIDGVRVPLTFIEALQALTRTEAAVLRFLGWGRSNADIGVLLGMNENTVRSHLNNAVRKLEVDGVRELNSIAGLLFHPVE